MNNKSLAFFGIGICIILFILRFATKPNGESTMPITNILVMLSFLVFFVVAVIRIWKINKKIAIGCLLANIAYLAVAASRVLFSGSLIVIIFNLFKIASFVMIFIVIAKLLNVKKKTILIIAIILALSSIFFTTFKIWQKEKTSLNIETTEEQSKVNNTVPVIFPKVEWLSYKNNDLGLTFDYPDKAVPNQYWTDSKDINQVIRSSSVLAKNNILYIKSGECSFDSVEAEYQKGKQEYGDGFGLDPSWRITVADVNNEQELDAFIKKHYGKDCTYHKENTIFQDTFDIVLESDGKPLDTTECPINYDYYLKYSPINKKVASWNTSQECQIGFSFDKCFDKQIAQSFHFITKEPITYINSNAYVSIETTAFDFKTDDLKYLADECGTKYESGHFDKLVSEFKDSPKIVYNFKYKGDSQGDGIFKVTILPNKAGYTSVDQFKKDFDQCAVAGDTYPKLVNKNWLLFVSSCGSGFDDGSGIVHGCDEVKNIVEPSLELN